MFPKIMVPPKSSILIGFSIIFTIHFGVFPPILGLTPVYKHVFFSPQKIAEIHLKVTQHPHHTSPNQLNQGPGAQMCPTATRKNTTRVLHVKQTLTCTMKSCLVHVTRDPHFMAYSNPLPSRPLEVKSTTGSQGNDH